MSQKQRTWKISENNEVITKRKGTETEIKHGKMLKNGKHKVLEGRKRSQDGKINGDGKNGRVRNERSQKITMVGNVQNETDTQTEKEDETESMIGCTGDYPHQYTESQYKLITIYGGRRWTT